MLYLISQLCEGTKFLSSIYLRGFLAFLISFFLVLFLGKPFIKYLKKKKYGEDIRENGPETHLSKKGTPTMGGVLIVSVILISTLLTGNLKNKYIILLMVITVLFSTIGFIDDYKKFTVNKNGLSGYKKLLGQFFIAIIVWGFVVYFKNTDSEVLNLSIINPFRAMSSLYVGEIGMLLFISIVLLGASNAVNITDGLDGLAIMPVIISAFIFSIIGYFTGHIVMSEHLKLIFTPEIGEVSIFLATVCGSGLGFLWYNFYPAQIFMGDTGSLALGGILGTVAIILKQELLFPIIGGIFVFEALSVILQVGSFKLRGKRIFKMAPIHHHFELRGQAESKVTMRFWIISIMFGILALGIIRMKGI